MKLTITRIGNELGIVLPQDLLERLQLKNGDTVDVSAGAGSANFIRVRPPAE